MSPEFHSPNMSKIIELGLPKLNIPKVSICQIDCPMIGYPRELDTTPGAGIDNILLENGGFMLTENGSYILLEK